MQTQGKLAATCLAVLGGYVDMLRGAQRATQDDPFPRTQSFGFTRFGFTPCLTYPFAAACMLTCQAILIYGAPFFVHHTLRAFLALLSKKLRDRVKLVSKPEELHVSTDADMRLESIEVCHGRLLMWSFVRASLADCQVT